ncbi:MAG: hydrogenase expression/formation protein HypE [Gammaproteobacteria bacterium]|nr:hydrogenase expression/formation protein HypE [Gammaproteobacteria bacterium]
MQQANPEQTPEQRHTPITLAHGNGGALMRQLIEECFAKALANDLLNTGLDAAPIPLPSGEVMITTDGFTVKPLCFPGGTIGSLAVHGTVNDLAVAGAVPLYLTLNAFIEEGLTQELLTLIVADMAAAAVAAGVRIVAGDTKVVPRGEGSGLYLATTGIGVRQRALPGVAGIKVGDKIVVSGSLGDHGAAVMLAREEFGLSGSLPSDSANVTPLCQAALQLPGLRFMRDPTRGGLITVCHDIARQCQLGVQLQERAIVVHESVATICAMLGYDPLYLANEGKVVAVVAADAAEALLGLWRQQPLGKAAAVIGTIVAAAPRVTLVTELGGERLLHELLDDPLPRIC